MEWLELFKYVFQGLVCISVWVGIMRIAGYRLVEVNKSDIVEQVEARYGSGAAIQVADILRNNKE